MILRLNPFPAGIRPEVAVRIAAFTHEAKVVPVRDVVDIHCEGWDIDAMLLKFIVPTKWPALASRKAKRGCPCRDFHAAGTNARGRRRRGIRLADSSVQRQLVQHVGQRLGVHQAVLDGHLEKLAMSECCKALVGSDSGADGGIQVGS